MKPPEELTDEELRIAIAEWCGMTAYDDRPDLMVSHATARKRAIAFVKTIREIKK